MQYGNMYTEQTVIFEKISLPHSVLSESNFNKVSKDFPIL